MQNDVLTPRLFFVACALAIGVVAQASPDATAPSSDAGAGDATVAEAQAPAAEAAPAEDASSEDAGETGCVEPTVLGDGSGPPANQLSGPPSDDGSLDDGYIAPFTVTGYSGDALGYLGVCQSLPTPFSYTSVKAPYMDATGCMAFNNLGHPNVQNCLCQKCFSLIQQCDALPLCQAALQCGENSTCLGESSSLASDCLYLFNGACVSQIDNPGNGSVAVGIFNALGTCLTNNKCPTK
jgi:hypothetical protein